MKADTSKIDFLKINGDKLAEWTGWNGFRDMKVDISGGSKEAWRTAILGAEKIAYDVFSMTSAENAGQVKKKRQAVNKELYQMYVTSPRYDQNNTYQGERVGTFWRYGMHPGLSIIDSMIDGHDAVGQAYGPKQAARDLLLPLPARQIYQSATYPGDQTKEDTAVRLFFSTILEEGGAGVQAFKPKK